MKLTPRDLLTVLYRYSRVIGAFWIIVSLAALIFYTETKRLYESRAKLLVSLGAETLGKADYVNGRNLLLQQREQQIHNEQQILESHEVVLTAAKWILGAPGPAPPAFPPGGALEEARKFFTMEDTPPSLLLRISRAFEGVFKWVFGHKNSPDEQVEAVARELSDDLSAKVFFDSDSLDVTFTYRDAAVAQTALKLILAAYMKHHVAVFQSSREADLLKSQLDDAVGKYHDQLGSLSTFMNSRRIYNDDSQATLLFENREKIQQSLNDALADNEAALARMASLKKIADSMQNFERYSTTEVRNKLRDDLEGKLNDASLEQKNLLSRHPEGSRAYQEQQAKLDEIRHLMEQEQGRVVDQTDFRRTKASEFVESEVINVTQAQRGLKAKVDQLNSDLRKIDSEISNYARDLTGFDAIKLDLNFAKQESEQMAQVYFQSRLKVLTADKAITNISVIDSPTYEPVAASPKGKLFVAATLLLLGFGTPALLIGAIFLDATVGDRYGAEAQLGTPVAAAFPMFKEIAGTVDAWAWFSRQSQSEFARIYQLLKGRGDQGAVVLLAESSGNQGASLLGYSLASFLERVSGKASVFIDQTEHSISESRGLLSTDGPPVRKLSGDQPDGAPGDAGARLAKLREEYGYVVIAAGALKDAVDLLAISGAACTTFFIVEPGKSSREAARYSLELLRQFGFGDIRLIVNKSNASLPDWVSRLP
jgi:uncharacterized protein involved in exopolysaccharide biosynthesis